MGLELDNITLAIVDCLESRRVEKALDFCTKNTKFGDVLFFTDLACESKYKTVPIPTVKNTGDYVQFLTQDLIDHIKTEFVMVCQYDGFIINHQQWTDEFLEYDYIGAPWAAPFVVGNGGFCIRSKKCLEVFKDLYTPNFSESQPYVPEFAEDWYYCVTIRQRCEDAGVKFAPAELGVKFAVEQVVTSQPTFGFHGNFHVDEAKIIYEQGIPMSNKRFFAEAFYNG